MNAIESVPDSGVPLLDSPRRRPRARYFSGAWPGLLLASSLLIPFLHKAHAVDDVTFLLQSQHALSDFRHPTAFEMVADGERIRLSSAIVTGPLMAWLLVPSVALGGAEWIAHLIQWAFVCLTILCTVRLGFRLGLTHRAVQFAGLFLASAPAVVGMAATSMSDVPAMALGALGVERFMAWVEDDRKGAAVWASLALAGAGLARPHALLLPAVAAFAIPRSHTRRLIVLVLPLVASLAIALAVARWSADPARAHATFLDALRARDLGADWERNLAAFGAHWLVALPFAVPWLWARAPRLARDPGPILLAALATAGLLNVETPAMSLPLAVATALAFVAIVDVLLDAARRRDWTQAWLGAWLLPALAAVAYVHLPCKMLLVSAPAAALLVARRLDFAADRLLRPVAAAVVALAAVLSLCILLADAEFTETGRRVAHDLIAPRTRAGESVRYYGAWGAQWYAIQAGADVAAADDPQPRSGEILVVSDRTPGARPDLGANLDSLGGMTVVSRFGQVMSARRGVGFYTNGYGYLPWTWVNDPIEHVTVWRVR